MKAPIKRFIGATLALIVSCEAFPVYAVETASAMSSCAIDSQVQALLKAQEDSVNGVAESFKAELTARQNILRATSACTVTEIKSTIADLRALPLPSQQDKQIVARITERLNDLLREPNLQDARIDEQGIRGTQDMARALKDWRVRIYTPEKERVQSFSLWLNTQKLIATAENRLMGIKSTLHALAIEDNDTITREVQSAEANLKSAREKYDRVRPLFEQMANPGEISSAIKNSLDALSSSYQSFFKISDEVKKVVPL